MMSSIDLEGALAVVTGAGSGIGQQTALALAGRGTRVLSVGRNAEAVQRTAARCRDLGPDAAAYRLDVTDRTGMEALAVQVAEEHGEVDILVNNAGVGMSGVFTDITADDWAWIRGVNLDGVVNGCAVFAPGMLDRRRGHIVNLSSGLAYLYARTEPAYVATKAAVLALSRSLRADFAQHGVGVTAICPGITNTPIVDHTRYLGSRGEDKVRARSKRLFDRGHPPEKVASVIIRAIERDRSVVPVGREAWLGWWLHRYLPLRAQQALATLPIT